MRDVLEQGWKDTGKTDIWMNMTPVLEMMDDNGMWGPTTYFNINFPLIHDEVSGLHLFLSSQITSKKFSATSIL